MKKVLLITGGTGYIGSHAVVAFEQGGYRTIIVDNLSNSSKEVLSGIEKILGYCPDFFECDIRDSSGLEEIFRKYSFDGVIHFAGLKSVGESTENPFLYYKNNVIGSLTLFRIMEEYGVKNIVFSSSATVYDVSNPMPLTEESLLGTTNPYGTSKLMIEKILGDLSKIKKWNVMNLRYFNPIGAHSSGIIGELPNGIPNNLFPYLIQVAKGVREKMYIFGSDYDTPDGTGVRDYIDINDLIDAHIMAYDRIHTLLSTDILGMFESYNIGTGVGTSVLDLLKRVERISGNRILYQVVTRRPGDLPIVYASPKHTEEMLGWKASRSLDQSILSGWNFVNNKL